jgi:hypothetical protein
MNPIDLILSRLKAHDCDPKPAGADEWRSWCPAHEGTHPDGLSVSRGEDGKVLVKCWAGCSFEAIAKALDLEPTDFFPPRPEASSRPPRTQRNGTLWRSAEDAIGWVVKQAKGQLSGLGPKIYNDRDGSEVFRVYRIDLPEVDEATGKHKKQFRPVHPDPIRNGWHIGDPSKDGLPLYHLDTLAAAAVVYVFEGEDCADRVERLGVTTTTSSHGSSGAAKSDWSPLVGKTVFLVPDHDDAGKVYINDVGAILKGLGVQAWVIHLPVEGKGHDAKEWLDSLPELWEPEDCRAKLEQLAAAAPEWVPPRAGSAASGTVTRCTSDVDDDAIPIPAEEWPDPPQSAAFHGVAGEIVEALAPETEADPAGCLIQFLVTFGSIVGNTPYVRLGGGFHHAKEFTLLVGRTGAAGRKGQSLDDTLPFFEDVDPEWSKNCRASGLSSAEGLIYRVRDPVEGIHHVKEKGRVVDTQTIVVDPGVEDKRLLVIETEFASVLKRTGREGNALSAVLRQAWDGQWLSTLTKGSPYRSNGCHVCVIGHITPEELSKLLAEVDIANGFINRFIIYCVRRSNTLPFGGCVPAEEMTAFRNRLKSAVEFAKATKEVKWTNEAQDLWKAHYDRLIATRPGAFGMATSRAEPHTLRLVVHYALLDKSARIRPVHVKAGLAAWDYAERSAALVFGNSTGDRDADRILEALRATPDGMRRSEIRLQVFGNNRPADVVASKLGLLLRLGQVRREPVATGGRPAELWFACGLDLKNSKNAESPGRPSGLPSFSSFSSRADNLANASAGGLSSISSFSSRAPNSEDAIPGQEEGEPIGEAVESAPALEEGEI